MWQSWCTYTQSYVGEIAIVKTAILAICLAASAAVSAGAPDSALSAKVDRFLAPLVERHAFSGVVVVTKGGKTLVSRAYGKADYEVDAPITASTRFRIASITKTFTGAAVAMLAERGKLSVKDPLSKYLPGFPEGDKIQLRFLLLHASGVPNPTSQSCSNATLDDLVAELAKKPLWFPPGTASGYSNGGYAILAKVVEIVSGKSWETFLRDEIFTPAGLSSMARDAAEPLMANRAAGYVPAPLPGGLANAPCSSAQAAFGSGALLSTGADLAQWARVVRNETLFKRTALEHPYGWGVRKYFGRAAIEQSGIMNGTASYVVDYLDDDTAIAVLSNVQSGALTDVGKGIAALAFGLKPPVEFDALPRPIASTADQRKPWLGTWKSEVAGTFRLVERNGSLYQVWGSAPTGSYVALTAERTAYNAQDSIVLELSNDTVRARWSEGEPREFTRQ